MAVLLLFLGIVLMGLTWKYAWRQAVNEEKMSNRMELFYNLEKRISAIESTIADLSASQTQPMISDKSAELGGLDYKMELLLRAVSGLEEKLSDISEKEKNTEEENAQLDFSTYIKESTQEQLFKSINEAYLSGKTVTEIAQEFGKGKGEVELILNLQK